MATEPGGARRKRWGDRAMGRQVHSIQNLDALGRPNFMIVTIRSQLPGIVARELGCGDRNGHIDY